MSNTNKLVLLAAAMSLGLPMIEQGANKVADLINRSGATSLVTRLGEAAAQENPDDDGDDDDDDDDPGGDGGEEDPGNDGAEEDPGDDAGDDPGGDDPGDDGGGDDAGDDGGAGDDDGAGGDDDGPGGDDDGPGGDDDGPGGDDDGPGGDDDGPGGDDGGGAGGGSSGGGDDDDDDDNGGGGGGGRSGDDDDPPGGAGVRGAGGGENVRIRDGDEDNRRPSDLPDGIDVDHQGRWIKAGEILALEADQTSLEFARSMGFQVIERHRLTTLGMSIVELRVPVGQVTREALEAVRRGDPDTAFDFNHVYLATQTAPVGQTITQRAPARAGAARAGTVGIVDTAVDAGHPALRGVRIQQVNFAGRDVPTDHGTAVASVLTGGGGGPGRLLAAGVVTRPDRRSGTTMDTASADALVRALDWMAQNNAPVVNVSLAGPPNAMVEDAVRRAQQRGMIIVAAVGNDGPAAPPLYPAAYDGVVGVTAVDERGGIYRRAGRGSHVDVAAHGVGVTVAGPAGRLVEASGTSYAAPQVAAALSEQHTSQDAQSARAAVSRLMNEVADAGERGPDPVFGAGVLRTEAGQ